MPELLIQGFLWITAIAVAVPLLTVTVEIFLALLPERKPSIGRRGTVAVIVPAHNEEAVLGDTLEVLRPQLTPGDRLIVVADNCDDGTARIAESHCVEVVERHNDEKRGKGFALDAGIQHLRTDPREVVIVVDADCVPSEDAIDRLSRAAITHAKPCQARYLMRPPTNREPNRIVSAFAFLVKNWVRPKGLARLGVPVPLMGSGMAFPWAIIENVSLATDNIVEDLALGIELAVQGDGARYCESAHVWSTLPSDEDGANAQRTRWEHGYLGTLLSQSPQLMSRILTGRFDLVPFFLDFAVPPLSLTVLSIPMAMAGLSLMGLISDTTMQLTFIVSVSVLFCASIVAAMHRFGTGYFNAKDVLSVPGYVLGKAPVYLSFLTRRQKRWVRTTRDPERAAA